jgi:hypothetical protein
MVNLGANNQFLGTPWKGGTEVITGLEIHLGSFSGGDSNNGSNNTHEYIGGESTLIAISSGLADISQDVALELGIESLEKNFLFPPILWPRY